MELLARTKLYLKYSLHYAVGILITIVLGLAAELIYKDLGLLLMPLMIISLYIKLHIDINRRIALEFTKRKLANLLPILMTSILLMTFKISINENIEYHKGCIDRISESKRLFNYLLFSFWSSIVLWEMYYRILKWKFNKKEKTMQLE